MMRLLDLPLRPSRRGEPSWELLDLLPLQGEWTVRRYKKLVDQNRMVEYTDGRIEVLPMPNSLHQAIIHWLVALLNNLVDKEQPVGEATFAPFILRLRRKMYRLPDVLFVKRENAHRINKNVWTYADLLVEIVSKGGKKRDYEAKRIAYAEAGIPEYWIVDPIIRKLTILVLVSKTSTYDVYGVFSDGQTASSPTIPQATIDVTEMFNRPTLIQ